MFSPARAPWPLGPFSSVSVDVWPVCMVGRGWGVVDDPDAVGFGAPLTIWTVCAFWTLYTDSASSSLRTRPADKRMRRERGGNGMEEVG